MDARITVRFYTVFPLEPGQPSFEACLKKVIGLGENPARDVDDNVIQASDLVRDGSIISGDLLRLQSENLPSLVARGNKPKKLSLASGASLGHHTAFAYDASLKILAFQMTRNAVPLSLFNGFVAKASGSAIVGFGPVIKAAELKLLNKMTPKTILIKVADPAHLEAVEDEERKLRSALLNLRTLAEGAYVKVQIGLGNNLGQLNGGRVKTLFTWLLEQKDKNKGKVSMVRVVGKDVNDENLPLDFIHAQVGESKTLALTGVGPAENYKRRSQFILESLEKHRDQLKSFHAGSKS